MRKIVAPEHLSAEAGAWYVQVVRDFDLDDTGQALLRMAGELWDRAESARKIVAAEGAIIRSSTGTPKEHPAAALERNSKVCFSRLVRELALGSELEEPGRPPRIRS